jgi:hypothetical protein
MTRMSPKGGRRLHFSMMAFWGVQMFVVLFVMAFDWRLYLLELSLYANFVGHWSGWSAERPTEMTKGGKIVNE